MKLLFVCTGNQCRSPIAAALARRLASERGIPLDVDSAGFLDGGASAAPDTLTVMDEVGVDLRDHVSQPVTVTIAESADAVATMTRQHLVQLLDFAPGVWPRCFTLVDLVHRAEANPRPPDEDPATWLRSLGAARSRVSILQLPLADDIDDPMGGPARGYERTRDTLRNLIGRFLDAAC